MQKEFKTYQEQIEILKSRGLKFKDEAAAKEHLKRENYYNIINGYKDLFLKPNILPEEFKEGVYFEEIYSLYKFDRSFRNILMKKILIFENSFKAIIAYEFSNKYGYKNYLNSDNFNQANIRNKKSGIKLIGDIHGDINRQLDKDNSLNHYLDIHGYIPLWVLIKIFTLGRVNSFYINMKDSDKNKIAKELAINYPLDSESIIKYSKLIALFRNLCAHEERMYNFKSLNDKKNPINLPLTSFHKKLGITGNRNGLFDVIICLKYLLNPNDFSILFDRLEDLIDTLSIDIKSISINNILLEMNFPKNWKLIIII
ncbi:Abi family protein [Candidatus Cetobacterium colombiensis]|uniref:Abi family protein n=1 Tax=Candidatus Cetobacterium colombiensis TaxID=3073100 RepID=A0ABU4WAN8_9FUSO|nr:Abi family protein [Candidatus Cetobacterium colombiensis]MDX8336602.1 Abi family protein [Candidatus Cetobacterium colombiensis]